ncbi:MAG TPA: tRNA (adenosine(37)-N6)-dimethylallyltransferase MiaA [Bacteroidales bacterium]|jgi:tRNA dimethylallyltransferase|nr:tRNA (adenosine(37)-N6)-dimethylallyltransferase MiaA [Bacteroidales bacterium]HQA87132.1 tRNA (adenosine(37)-N6)-dimethylallyltransferase MiaA [Bacteroidales bacterium]
MKLKTFNKPTLIVIAGPTAVGKTKFCLNLAKKYQTSIISADSRQFYRELKIGTAAPTEQELQTVPHYFIAHLSIHDYYSTSRFEQDVLQLLPSLFQQNQVVIMTGGSGLYLDTVCHGIDELPDPDPEIRQYVIALYEKKGIEELRKQLRILDYDYYQKVDIANYKRLMRAIEVSLQTGMPYSKFLQQKRKKRDFEIEKYCLVRPREILFERINRRVDEMMENNLLQEAKQLHPYRKLNALNTVGYKELFQYIEGQITLEEAINNIKVNTRRYAKRQLNWFKRDPNYQYIDLAANEF